MDYNGLLFKGSRPALSVEEEYEFFLQYKTHPSPQLLDKLVVHNLRLVFAVVNKYPPSHKSDLLGEGCLGLIRAIQKFEPERGVKFSTYAVPWIKAFVITFLLNNFRMVRFGTDKRQRKLYYQLNKAKSTLLSQGKEISVDNLAELLALDTEEVEKAVCFFKPEIQLNEVVRGTHEDSVLETTRLDMMTAEGLSPEEAVEELEKLEILQDFKKNLKPTEQMVFDLRFLRGETLQAVGDQMQRTRERVRQIEEIVEKKLMIRFPSISHSAL